MPSSNHGCPLHCCLVLFYKRRWLHESAVIAIPRAAPMVPLLRVSLLYYGKPLKSSRAKPIPLCGCRKLCKMFFKPTPHSVHGGRSFLSPRPEKGTQQENLYTAEETKTEAMIQSKCADWRAVFSSDEGEKSQEYFVYFKISRRDQAGKLPSRRVRRLSHCFRGRTR